MATICGVIRYVIIVWVGNYGKHKKIKVVWFLMSIWYSCTEMRLNSFAPPMGSYKYLMVLVIFATPILVFYNGSHKMGLPNDIGDILQIIKTSSFI